MVTQQWFKHTVVLPGLNIMRASSSTWNGNGEVGAATKYNYINDTQLALCGEKIFIQKLSY